MAQGDVIVVVESYEGALLLIIDTCLVMMMIVYWLILKIPYRAALSKNRTIQVRISLSPLHDTFPC